MLTKEHWQHMSEQQEQQSSSHFAEKMNILRHVCQQESLGKVMDKPVKVARF